MVQQLACGPSFFLIPQPVALLGGLLKKKKFHQAPCCWPAAA
jgi:hypothetical protein